MREAAARHNHASTRQTAIAAEAEHLQQQAGTERRVAVFAHHRLQEQQGLAQQQDSRAAPHHSIPGPLKPLSATALARLACKGVLLTLGALPLALAFGDFL